jgi:hypothetical protein
MVEIVLLSPEDENRTNFQNVGVILTPRRWVKSEKTVEHNVLVATTFVY